MAVKTQELCEKCKYCFAAWCQIMGCSKCPQNVDNSAKRCKCLKVYVGQDCPMFIAREDVQ